MRLIGLIGLVGQGRRRWRDMCGREWASVADQLKTGTVDDDGQGGGRPVQDVDAGGVGGAQVRVDLGARVVRLPAARRLEDPQLDHAARFIGSVMSSIVALGWASRLFAVGMQGMQPWIRFVQHTP